MSTINCVNKRNKNVFLLLTRSVNKRSGELQYLKK